MGRIAKFLKLFLSNNILFLYRNSKSRSIIRQDICRWHDILTRLPRDTAASAILPSLFQIYPEFRNLFYFRLRKDPIKKHLIYRLTYRFLYPPKPDLVIGAVEDIGPGLFIQHGRSSGISVKRMGANCWVNQHVSIGYRTRGEEAPTIGNNVRITAGAKVYGPITIGDHAIIGANAVVVKNVPPRCTVIGVPGRIVKRDGHRVDEPL